MISAKNKINYFTMKFPRYFREMRDADFRNGVTHTLQLLVDRNGEEKEYLFSGGINGSELLRRSLHRLGLSYKTTKFNGKEIPESKGQDYQVLGMGTISTFTWKDEEFLIFFKSNLAYPKLSINRGSLEDSFGKERVIDLNNKIPNSFLVDYLFENNP